MVDHIGAVIQQGDGMHYRNVKSFVILEIIEQQLVQKIDIIIQIFSCQPQ